MKINRHINEPSLTQPASQPASHPSIHPASQPNLSEAVWCYPLIYSHASCITDRPYVILRADRQPRQVTQLILSFFLLLFVQSRSSLISCAGTWIAVLWGVRHVWLIARTRTGFDVLFALFRRPETGETLIERNVSFGTEVSSVPDRSVLFVGYHHIQGELKCSVSRLCFVVTQWGKVQHPISQLLIKR